MEHPSVLVLRDCNNECDLLDVAQLIVLSSKTSPVALYGLRYGWLGSLSLQPTATNCRLPLDAIRVSPSVGLAVYGSAAPTAAGAFQINETV